MNLHLDVDCLFWSKYGCECKARKLWKIFQNRACTFEFGKLCKFRIRKGELQMSEAEKEIKAIKEVLDILINRLCIYMGNDDYQKCMNKLFNQQDIQEK